MRFKLAVWWIGLLCLVGSIAHAQQSDGSDSDQDVSKLRLKLPFVDRTQFVDRGAIVYTTPPMLNDGIPVADARDFGDLQSILELLNQTERKNQEFRIGKGEPHKRGGRKPYDPKIVGCIDSLLVAKNGKLILEEYFEAFLEVTIKSINATCSIGLVTNLTFSLLFPGLYTTLWPACLAHHNNDRPCADRLFDSRQVLRIEFLSRLVIDNNKIVRSISRFMQRYCFSMHQRDRWPIRRRRRPAVTFQQELYAVDHDHQPIARDYQPNGQKPSDCFAFQQYQMAT